MLKKAEFNTYVNIYIIIMYKVIQVYIAIYMVYIKNWVVFVCDEFIFFMSAL